MSAAKREKIPKKIRKQVAKRANHCCEYCKYLKAFCGDPFVIEHINPLSKDGKNTLSNYAYSCFGCNQSKFTATEAIDPITQKTVPLFHPRKNIWNEHFKWSSDLLTAEGITPIGRATIGRLRINRVELVNLRRFLIGNGHPPE